MTLLWSVVASIVLTAVAAQGCIAGEPVAASGGAANNLATIEQAFGSYASGEATRRDQACPRSGAAHSGSPGDGDLRPSILGFKFDCAEERISANTQDDRLAAAFQTVLDARDARTDDLIASFGLTADGRELAFGRFLDASQLPAPIATREVEEEQLRDAPIEEAAIEAAAIEDAATLPGVKRVAALAGPEVAEIAETGEFDAVRSEVEAGLQVVAFDDSDQPRSAVEPEAASSAVGSIRPDALATGAVASHSETPKTVEATKRTGVSRSAVTRPLAPRRKVRTVSVSRTVRTPRPAARLVASPQRIYNRGTTPVAESAPALAAPRPRARSFSPKMSSAGPAQTTPSPQR